MTKLQRKTQAIFASSAGSRSLTAFGTAKNDDPTYTTDPDVIQNNAYNYGWEAAILADKAPYEEDTNALFYMITRQLAYLFQNGIAEYDRNTEYYKGSVCQEDGVWYKSLSDGNINNPLTDTAYWKKILLSKQGMPLFTKTIQDHILQGEDAIGWALQGTLVQASVYPEAFEKLLSQYNQGTSVNYRGISCTLSPDGRYIAPLEQKNAIDTLFLNTGISDFYVIDPSNSSFYLPKNSKFIQFSTNSQDLNKYNEAALPAPNISEQTLTAQSAGEHTHTRGTMNITGSFPIVGARSDKYTDAQYAAECSGAFTEVRKSNSPYGEGSDRQSTTAVVSFNAANAGAWTGLTSQEGVHTHNVTLNAQSLDSGIFGKSNTVQPAASINLLYYLVGETAV